MVILIKFTFLRLLVDLTKVYRHLKLFFFLILIDLISTESLLYFCLYIHFMFTNLFCVPYGLIVCNLCDDVMNSMCNIQLVNRPGVARAVL